MDAYFKNHLIQGKRHFAVMPGDRIIGDVYLKQTDHINKEGTTGMHLKNDSYKNQGDSTQAVAYIVQYALNDLEYSESGQMH